MLARTLWFTGLPAAGKTTLAQASQVALSQRGIASVVLDGDALRAGLCRDLGFSPADRAEQMRRVAEMAALLNNQGVWVLVALVSPTRAGREQARARIGGRRYLEIHVATPLEVCQARDPKGLYARALSGELAGLTGIDAPYEAPEHPDFVIHSQQQALATSVAQILGHD